MEGWRGARCQQPHGRGEDSPTGLCGMPSSAALAVSILGLVTFTLGEKLGTAQAVDQLSAGPSTAASGGSQPVVVEEVTVISTKTQRDPVDTPGEVSIITREEIERTQASSLKDVLKYQPGVELEGGPRRIGETPVIRGLEGPRILMTIDGARLNFQSGHKGKVFLDMDILKQIEVVRGPASALWGSGALGGVVAFTTKDPADYLAGC